MSKRKDKKRSGLKAEIRRRAQAQTKRAVRLGSKPRHYVGAGAVNPNGASAGTERAPVPGSPSQSVYVLANRSGRKLAFIAADEAEAREKAVASGLVKKPENAKLYAVNP